MASLQGLRKEAEAFCRAQAESTADEVAGRIPLADLGAVDRAHPTVVAPDTAAALRAALGSERTPEAQRARLAELVTFVERAAVEAGARTAHQALRQARRAASVSAAGVSRPLSVAWAEIAGEPDRDRRAAVSRATEAAELQLLALVQRRWESARTGSQRAAVSPPGAPDSPEREAALEADARTFLRSTEDAWREVLAYACRRLAPELRPLPRGDAALHDLIRLSAEPLPGAFPPADRLPALRRWLDRSGLTLEAGGRVRLEAHLTPGTPFPADAFAVEVPARIRLVTPGPALGHGSFPALLDAAGRARAAAAVSEDASLEARRMGDPAVLASAGWLFRGVLRSEAWLRRSLGHGRTSAREVARLSALGQLGGLRMLALRRPLVRALAFTGPTRSGVEAVAAALSEGLFVQVGPGAVLPTLDPWPTESVQLRAAALAERLLRQADERFDADDLRNPAAAGWLAGLWARGGERDAETVAQELSRAPLSLVELSERLLAVLGA